LGGSGFWASAIRGFVTSVHVLLSAPFEFKVVGMLDDLVTWLPTVHARRTGVQLLPDELLAVLRAAQRHGLPVQRAS
jgi:hypothetical protein